MKDSKLGVLLLNLGTPDQPTTQAIRRYLAEFLSDPRVVDIPRWLWLPVLYLFILRVRPHSVAGKYRKIWGRKDSPLRIIMYALAGRTERALEVATGKELQGESIMVRPAMTYGSPGIRHSVEAMKQQGINKVEMARRLSTSRSQLDRLLDPKNEHVTLHLLSRAAQAVGRSLKLELQ